MDSPQPSKNNNDSGSTSYESANTNISGSLSDSPQVQESPFLRYVSTLSPITIKASHVAQGFLGLNSPPLVFKSPRISHHETQFVGRPQGTQSLGGEISQSGNGSNCLGEAPAHSGKSNSQQPLSERSITGTQEVFDPKHDSNTQNNSSSPSIEQYLVDPADIDQMYAACQDVVQSTDAAETSLSDPTQSKKDILKIDRKDGPSDKAEESLPLSEDSNKVHQQKPIYGEEPEKMEEEKNDVEWASQDPTNLDSHDQLSKDIKGCEDYNHMVSTSHVTSENILQDDSVALKYHGNRRRCLQFAEAASKALGSNKSHVKQNATSSETKMVMLSETITSSFPQKGSGSFTVKGPKPSGIGLHLNSIINAMPTGQAATTGVRSSDDLQGIKPSSSIRLQRIENVKRSILLSHADGQSLVDTRNESHEIDASVATDSLVSESPVMTEPSPSYSASALDKRKLSPIDDGNSEELNQPLSASKKKKKASATADGNGCKRCRCKKSKCLKLYCDCFALGIYCTDPCECQGCLNRPEYADTVRETRQQIESRDPLAFAPKIENINLTTPSSARHKRGCNCKKSTCLKKYCECYQANVGCSSACRCEGCKNSYGKKEDRVALEQHALSKERASSIAQKGLESTLRSKLQLVTNMRYDLSPTTSSLQCSDQGKEAAKSRVISGNYLPSPVSHTDMFLSYANCTRSSDNLRSSQSFLETNEMLGTAPRALFQLTPLSNPEPLSNEWTNVSQSQLSYGCIRQLPGGSLGWHSSPVTPSTRVGEAQHLQCPESDSRTFNIPENETPDMLQEASPPMRSVKVNSPTQKRVAPPQIRHCDIGSFSSGKLTNGRKFASTSVPSFPPLSPCVDSKGNDNGNENLGNRDSR